MQYTVLTLNAQIFETKENASLYLNIKFQLNKYIQRSLKNIKIPLAYRSLTAAVIFHQVLDSLCQLHGKKRNIYYIFRFHLCFLTQLMTCGKDMIIRKKQKEHNKICRSSIIDLSCARLFLIILLTCFKIVEFIP